jgi:hypothetical protein
MCEPVTIAIAGAAIGGGIGYATTGDAKGALIGAGIGATGGYLGASAAGLGVGGPSTLGAAGTGGAGGVGAGVISSGAAPNLAAIAASGGTGTALGATGAGTAAGTSMFTLGNVLTGLSLLGTGATMLGQRNAATSASNLANYQAMIARNNETMMKNNARFAMDKAKADIADVQLRKSIWQGQQRAELAAMGFNPDEGSSIDILADTAVLANIDSERILQQAEHDAWGFDYAASGFAAEAGLQKYAAKDAKTAGRLAVAGTLVSGATSAGTTFLQTRDV